MLSYIPNEHLNSNWFAVFLNMAERTGNPKALDSNQQNQERNSSERQSQYKQQKKEDEKRADSSDDEDECSSSDDKAVSASIRSAVDLVANRTCADAIQKHRSGADALEYAV